MIEVFIPAIFFMGTIAIIKGIEYTCIQTHKKYVKRRFKKLIYKKITKKQFDEDCVICLCNYTENKKRVQLYCDHYFHKSCMNEWIKEKPTCPLCNTVLKTKNNKYKIRIIRD
jgi:hypothetical protein